MAWTYTADFSQPRDMARLLLGDTSSAEQLCSDEEVALALSEVGGNEYLAAAWLADRLAARFAGDEAVSGDGLSLSGSSQRSASYRTLAANLRSEAARRGGAVLADAPGGGALVLTGARRSDLAAADADLDRPRFAFRRELPLVPDVDEVVL